MSDRGKWCRAAALAAALMLVGGACSSDSDAAGGGAETTAGGETSTESTSTTAPAGSELFGAGGALELLPLQTSGTRIVDTSGRDVLLRGANVNSLGEYWQGLPEVPATIPMTDEDWDLMASHGFSVIRLLITWSRVEPERGQIDQAYLDEIEEMVEAAAAHGIYSVIDMHQDAYSAFIYTSDANECMRGTSPAKGWDGAPEWATLTDGLSTCLERGDRNSSQAVEAAWNHFYGNTDGIRDHFVAAWASVAERFAGRPEVAGFDLLNEPENPMPAGELQPIYEAFMAETIEAIRAAQTEAGAPFEHILFVEPALPAADLSRGLVPPTAAAFGGRTENVGISIHNYMESINHIIPLESLNDSTASLSEAIGVPNWGGEYGFWNTEPDTLAVAIRYALDEDANRWGGAWWQWRQSCGDPHSVQWENGVVVNGDDRQIHLNILGCPGNTDLGPNDDFLRIVGRGFARATPGVLDALTSDVETGALSVSGTATAAGGTLVVWSPTPSDDAATVTVEGLAEVEEHEVVGGRYLTATVSAAGPYRLQIAAVG
ncbi:MAG: glycoside hydrolase family 5 protein [Actinobacteria bacterium]|nr:glycoside hydrolase family 5 protein [Actinomycetota bacterium]